MSQVRLLVFAGAFCAFVVAGCKESKPTDMCTPDVCQNGGTCSIDAQGGLVCACLTGFSGPTCALSEQACDPNPCENGGTCEPAAGGYKCTCPAGITGTKCQTLPASCSPNPCQNGGACAISGGTIKCTCLAGYGGATCADNIDDCSPNPCLSGGVCTDGLNSYTCACTAGHTGTNCEMLVDGCSPNPCMNGGTCALMSGMGVCTCAAGYSGAACETNIDDCMPNPCKHGGTCHDGVNSFTCDCAGGYIGADCSTYNPPQDLNLSHDNTGARTCTDGGDMVSYSVKTLTSTTAQLVSTPAAGCLAVDDEVLLINLQGTSTTSASIFNTGNWELLMIGSIAGDTVTFKVAKQRHYGDAVGGDTNIGTSTTQQRVVLQRVPKYDSLKVSAGFSLTVDGWDGTKGGVFAMRVTNDLTVEGSIDMAGKGYAGGVLTTGTSNPGQEGESLRGKGSALGPPNTGGGGGGSQAGGCAAYGTSGGGGGYGTAGTDGANGTCSGKGGVTYGDDGLTQIFLGSGGGAGGSSDPSTSPPGGYGGAGGGIILVFSDGKVEGSLTAAGLDGYGDAAECTLPSNSTTDCWDDSGPGGGGAGGSILVSATNGFTGVANVVGGKGGDGVDTMSTNGGAGGSGRAKTN